MIVSVVPSFRKATHSAGRILVTMVCLLALTTCAAREPSGDSAIGEVVSAQPISAELIGALKGEQPAAAGEPVATPPNAAPYEYQLGAGDVLNFKLQESQSQDAQGVTVPASKTGPIKIESNGSASFPYVGEMLVAGKTMTQLREMLLAAYKEYFRTPDFDVQVNEFRSQKITISGAVAKPGIQYLNYEPLSIRKALEVAGGPTEVADIERVELIRRDASQESVNLLNLLFHGDIREERILLSGDTLLIPQSNRNKVFVLGEVMKPSAQLITPGKLSLTEALNAAGGVNPITASESGIYVIRNAISRESLAAHDSGLAKDEAADVKPPGLAIYQLDTTNPAHYMLGDQFMLQPRDIIYVATSPITNWNRFISQVISLSLSYSTSSKL